MRRICVYLRSSAAALLIVSTCAIPPIASAQPRPAQEEFVPVADAETERLPAAPLVMSAYAAAWVLIFLYIWSLWRRLNRVERELAGLAPQGPPKGR